MSLLKLLSSPFRTLRYVVAGIRARHGPRDEKLRFVTRSARVAARLVGVELDRDEDRMIDLIPDLDRLSADDPGQVISRLIDLFPEARRLAGLYTAINVGGRPFYFDPRRLALSQLEFLIDRIHNHDCYGFDAVVEDSPVVVDCGAHLGVFSRFALQRKPNATVYAFEPNQEIFTLLTANLAPFGTGYPMDDALLDTVTVQDFYTSDEVDWRSILAVKPEFRQKDEFRPDEFRTTYQVKTLPLDDLISEKGVERVDFIKISGPGEIEPLILEGARATIERYRPHMAISVYPVNRDVVRRFFEGVGGYRKLPCPWNPDNPQNLIRLFVPEP